MKRLIATRQSPRRFCSLWFLGVLLVGLSGCGAEPGDDPGHGGGGRDDGGVGGGQNDGGHHDGGQNDGGPDGSTQNQPPSAVFTVTKLNAGKFQLDASPSKDPEGDPLSYAWSVSTGETATGKLAELTVSTPDCVAVTLKVTDTHAASGTAKKNVGIPGVGAPGALSGLPAKGAFLPRSKATGKHELELNLAKAGGLEKVETIVFDETNKKEVSRQSAQLCGAGPQKWTVSLPAGLRSYRLSVRGSDGSKISSLGTTSDIVVGDAIFISGQSNAVALRKNGAASAAGYASPFVRSFGTLTANASITKADTAWHRANGDAKGGPGGVGQWGLVLGKLLSQQQGVAIAVLNGGEGGANVGFFQRKDSNPGDLGTNYGRLLYRAKRAGLQNSVRAFVFYQGESDLLAYGWGSHAAQQRKGFTNLRNDWRQDFPSLERIYITQIHYGCGSSISKDPGHQAHRNVQRLLALEDAKTGLMVMNGISGQHSDKCHFLFKEGYRRLGERYANLLARDLYGKSLNDVEPVNVSKAKIVSGKVRIGLVGDFTKVIADAGSVNNFSLGGYRGRFSSAVVVGKELVLTPKSGVKLAPGAVVAYRGHTGVGPWVKNARGVGLATFELALGT